MSRVGSGRPQPTAICVAGGSRARGASGKSVIRIQKASRLNWRKCEETSYSIWSLGKELPPSGPLYSFNPVWPKACVVDRFDAAYTYRERGLELDVSLFEAPLPATE